jgi:subfamily B ATP-binding cassette protein MsbA
MAVPVATARRILGYVWPYRLRLGLAVGCMLVLAATTSAYAFLTGPLLEYLLTGGNSRLKVLERFAPDFLSHLDRQQMLFVLPALMLAIAALKGLAYLGQFYVMGMLGQRVVADIRRELFRKLLGLSPTYFERHHSGDLLSRFTADVAAVELFATYGVASVLRDGVQVVSLLALAFVLDWKLSLLALTVVPLAALPMAKLAGALRRQIRAGQVALGQLGERVQEGLWGLNVIQAYHTERAELARFDRENARHLEQMRKAVRSRTLGPSLVELLLVAVLAGTLALAARAVAGGSLEPSRLVSFIATMAMLYQPAKDLGRVTPWLLQATAGAERIFEVLDAVSPLAAQGEASLGPLQNEVHFDGIDFDYGNEPVLRGLNLKLRRGEVVALVGESGGGKSTAVKLLLRFVDPSRGAVRIDGQDARSAKLADVRAQCALVTQEPLLFAESVKANLCYARPDAKQEEIVAAAKATGADAFIQKLPQGYDTLIGERGVRLSGGQKQRLALARALLAGAPVLVLDEATSNLDPESEREVQSVLDELLHGRTALVIAHRLSSVRNADRICVLKGGRLLEEGRHDELLALGGEYARLYALQSGEPAAPTPTRSQVGNDAAASIEGSRPPLLARERIS